MRAMDNAAPHWQTGPWGSQGQRAVRRASPYGPRGPHSAAAGESHRLVAVTLSDRFRAAPARAPDGRRPPLAGTPQ